MVVKFHFMCTLKYVTYNINTHHTRKVTVQSFHKIVNKL